MAMKIGFLTRLLCVAAAVFLGSAGAHLWHKDQYNASAVSAGQWKIGFAIGFLAISTLGAGTAGDLSQDDWNNKVWNGETQSWEPIEKS